MRYLTKVLRILIGVTLLIVGLVVMCGALAATHTGPPTDLLRADTWLFWSLFVVPLGLGLFLLFGKRARRPLR